MAKVELFNDNFENAKKYGIPKAQLIIADIPYNIGVNAYASNPSWYIDGDNKNGESKLAKKAFFNTDYNFNIYNYFRFCTRMLKPEPKEAGKAPCMIIFCAFEQMADVIELGKQNGFKHNIPIFFIKNFSAQVLKANMRVVGAMEYAVILYRDKLPKFNNKGRMVFNWFKWQKDGNNIPKIHPTQKPVEVLKELIEIFTDKDDVVIDPVAGSGSTLRACMETGRRGYGFEISKNIYKEATTKMINNCHINERFDLFEDCDEICIDQYQLDIEDGENND